MKTSDEIKLIALQHLRYQLQYSLVGTEISLKLNSNNTGDRADVLAVMPNNQLLQGEVKVTIADLKNDIRKGVHQKNNRYPTAYFYFIVPEEIKQSARQVILDLYPDKGLWVVKRHTKFLFSLIEESIRAAKLNNHKLNNSELRNMQKGMSSTLCRLYAKVLENP